MSLRYHTLEVTRQADGTYRFLCGAQQDKTFTGNDGEIATLQVTIAEDMADGEYAIYIKNILMSESDITKYDEIEQELSLEDVREDEEREADDEEEEEQ